MTVMNVWGVTSGGYLAKILSFKSGDLLYKSNFYLLSEGTVSCNLREGDKGTLHNICIKFICFLGKEKEE